MWNKNTNWRQGSIVKVEVFKNYSPGAVKSLLEDITYLCVVSSDGDIINDDTMLEPVVEFVGVKEILAADPGRTNAKHPSVLHLPCLSGGKQVILELSASPKLSVSKHNLIPALQPDKNFFFDDDAKATLQNWLSFRYRRRSLPKAFVARTMPLWNYLKKEGKKYVAHAMGYWINYDPRGEELTANDPYLFSLYIVYSNRHHKAQEQSEKLALEIRSNFPDWQNAMKDAGEIEMHECRAYSEDCFTLADLQNCVHFSLDQIDHIQVGYTPEIPENKEKEAEDTYKA